MPNQKPTLRRVKLFLTRGHRAVGIPDDLELPGDEAILRRDGDRLIIEPLREGGLVALLASWEASGEDFPIIDDPQVCSETVF